MNHTAQFTPALQAAYDADLKVLDAAKHDWANTSVGDRIGMLVQVKNNLAKVAEDWAAMAAKAKGIPDGSPLMGEEWFSGPYALMSTCNGLITTLSKMADKAFLDPLPKRELPNGRMAVRVLPHSIWDHLLLSGITAEVWMQEGVSARNLKDHAASAYDMPEGQRVGKVALILGAGNIAAITPLDAFQKLFLENQVALVKMNPVNDYLTEYLNHALQPLIDANALRVRRGDGAAGAYLTNHALVEEIHITGARATHDAIVWGADETGTKNKAAGTPANTRPITSELGAVCPTIVVPGPWTAADLRFQAENIATMKLHNSGFNCVALQCLILPKGWNETDRLMAEISSVIEKHTERAAYYPGTDTRMDAFNSHSTKVRSVKRGAEGPACLVADMEHGDTDWLGQNEVFAPAMGVMHLDAPNAESYLRAAIRWANETLYGTLGGNILIHSATIRTMGRKRFDEIIAEFRYGTIAINTWTGLAFLATACPWGGFAGASPGHVESGIGTVHNTFMLDGTERTVVEAPFRPFPRNLLSGRMTLLPRPPWFVSNTRQDKLGKLLTQFQYRPSVRKLPRIFLHALSG